MNRKVQKESGNKSETEKQKESSAGPGQKRGPVLVSGKEKTIGEQKKSKSAAADKNAGES